MAVIVSELEILTDKLECAEDELSSAQAEIERLKDEMANDYIEYDTELHNLYAENESLIHQMQDMRCCGNCFNFANLKDCGCKAENEVCENWEMKE